MPARRANVPRTSFPVARALRFAASARVEFTRGAARTTSVLSRDRIEFASIQIDANRDRMSPPYLTATGGGTESPVTKLYSNASRLSVPFVIRIPVDRCTVYAGRPWSGLAGMKYTWPSAVGRGGSLISKSYAALGNGCV